MIARIILVLCIITHCLSNANSGVLGRNKIQTSGMPYVNIPQHGRSQHQKPKIKPNIVSDLIQMKKSALKFGMGSALSSFGSLTGLQSSGGSLPARNSFDLSGLSNAFNLGNNIFKPLSQSPVVGDIGTLSFGINPSTKFNNGKHDQKPNTSNPTTEPETSTKDSSKIDVVAQENTLPNDLPTPVIETDVSKIVVPENVEQFTSSAPISKLNNLLENASDINVSAISDKTTLITDEITNVSIDVNSQIPEVDEVSESIQENVDVDVDVELDHNIEIISQDKEILDQTDTDNLERDVAVDVDVNNVTVEVSDTDLAEDSSSLLSVDSYDENSEIKQFYKKE